ncbi:Exonuclease 1 [Paramuricea clavata]|uniref:Exonuclease 1 n=1 Tax=Paramuricea clavata TaxID=317549 RepID=A0A7D9DY79_PARCT|nr:Exonuclease 1 [Paramuricea clavata]
MGIKTLLPFLREVTRKANLEEFKGQTAAVDASCLLHRALSISMSRNGDESRLLDLLNSYVDLLERNEIKPYVVFDGLRLPTKELERVRRTRRREEIRAKANELRKEGELCRDRNIDYTVAPYEADAQIAYLMKHGQVDFAISEDSDLLAFGCQKVLFKMETSGMCDCIELSDALENLGMTQTKVLEMCIVAGCDYLPNIRGIGINKARKLVVEEADLMKALLNLKNVPEGYKNRFLEAKSVFLHQTVIDTKTKETVPLSEWRDTPVATSQQNMCGKYPFNLYDRSAVCLLSKEKSLNVSIGNINPEEMDVILSTFPLPVLVQYSACSDDVSTVSNREHNNEDDTTEIKVTITSIERASFPWRIPSFPVITLNFKKVKFTLSNGQQSNGVVNKDIDIAPGRFCCSSHCTIRVDNEDLVVLWTLSPLKNTIQSVARVQVRNVGEETDDYSGEHTLPFKVMGTCYWTSRQDALEEAYTYLHEYNRHVFAKLVEEPENVNDSNAIDL